MDRLSIYKLIVESSMLLPHHRKQLIEKRGFTNEIIDKFQFRSSGEYLFSEDFLDTFTSLPEEYQWALKNDGILIPYLDPNGDVIHLRPHKSGFSNAGANVFVPYHLLEEGNTKELVLAESEFKAIASCMMGKPAIGIPGISSFSRKNLSKLIDIFHGLGTKKVVICFDNEIKNDPQFENYKPDYTKRYEVLIYEYVMAYLLNKNNLKTTIAKLKPKWMVNGKADIDGVLSQGISAKEYQNLIDSSVSETDYRNQWELADSHKSFIERRIQRFLYKGPIQESFLSYTRIDMVTPDDKSKEKRLSNFVIRISYTVFGEEGAERFCYLDSNFGKSKKIILRPDMMVSKNQFQKFCYELGDFEFYGGEKELQDIWHFVFLHQDGRQVRKLKYMGHDSETGIWFFSNGAYYKNIFYPADEDSIVWIEDSGFMLPFNGESALSPMLSSEAPNFTTVDILNRLRECMEPNTARLILGWAIGNFFMPEILKEWSVYPFLFFFGKQQVGKSTLANWITSFYGFTQKGVPFSGSTVAGIKIATSVLSMIPLWLEEYRNKDDAHITKKNSLLRSIYDKSTIIQSDKQPGILKTYTARSTLVISGEEQPADSALNSRCLAIPVSRVNYNKNEDAFRWLQTNSQMFNYFGHEILTNKEKYWGAIKKQVDGYIKAFEETEGMKADNRSRKHFSVVAGVCDVFFGEEQTFIDYIGEKSVERTLFVDHSQALNVFLNDVWDLWSANSVHGTIITKIRNVRTKRDESAFCFSNAYAQWEQRTKGLRETLPHAKQAISHHLKSEPYYLREGTARIDGKTLRCFILDQTHVSFPESLAAILDQTSASTLYAAELIDSNFNEMKMLAENNTANKMGPKDDRANLQT